MPTENGLPPYTSKHPDTKLYRYFRRPPTGVAGKVFSRTYATKDKKVVWSMYPAIHADAEVHFGMLRSGRTVTDAFLRTAASAIVPPLTGTDRLELDRENFRTVIENRGGSWLVGMTDADKDMLITEVMKLYASDDLALLDEVRTNVDVRAAEARSLVKAPASKTKFTLTRAFDEAWKPAKTRPEGSVTEVKRYVEEFIALNGDHALVDLTRDHWAAWRTDCLNVHGPGWTAFKRFNMVKAVVNEAIRAGLFERKHHTGQDVVLTKPGRTKLRNEGWSDDELKELFTSEPFTVFDGKHRDAEYWVPTIIALTGARLSEVTGMQVPDVGNRHGVLTFFLAREAGKTEESRRIIPVPQKLIDLGLSKYIATLDAAGPLFPGINSDIISKWFGRHRRAIGVDRKGCDIHAMRHHIKTKLGDLGAPDRVNNYITGHVGNGGVGATYGKTELQTALRFLDQIDLGVTIPKWSPPDRD